MTTAIIHDDINDATGYANGDTFKSPKAVREYFTVATQVEMFGDDAVTDQDVLDGFSERVIESGSHCDFNLFKIRLMHNSSIPGARWCEPIGWEPSNEIEGAEFADGSWWSDSEEEAGLVWFGDVNAYGSEEVIDASLDDLRVASCGDCRVIGTVEV